MRIECLHFYITNPAEFGIQVSRIYQNILINLRNVLRVMLNLRQIKSVIFCNKCWYLLLKTNSELHTKEVSCLHFICFDVLFGFSGVIDRKCNDTVLEHFIMDSLDI